MTIAIYDNTSGEILFLVSSTSGYDLTGRSTITVPDYPEAWRWNATSKTFVLDFSNMFARQHKEYSEAVDKALLQYEISLNNGTNQLISELDDYETNGDMISTREFRFPIIYGRWISGGGKWDDAIAAVRAIRTKIHAVRAFAYRQKVQYLKELQSFIGMAIATPKYMYDRHAAIMSNGINLFIPADGGFPPIWVPEDRLQDAPLTRFWLAPVSGTTPVASGMGNSVAGTITNPGLDNSSFVTSMPRLRYTATSAVPRCSWSHNERDIQAKFLDKNGGFQFGIRWRFANWESGAKFFVGLLPRRLPINSAFDFDYTNRNLGREMIFGVVFDDIDLYPSQQSAVNSLGVKMGAAIPVYKRYIDVYEDRKDNILPDVNGVYDMTITQAPGSAYPYLRIRGPDVQIIELPYFLNDFVCPQFYIDKGTATNDVAIEVYKMWITTY